MPEERKILEEEVRNLLKLFSTAVPNQYVHDDSSRDLRLIVTHILRSFRPLSSLDVLALPDAGLTTLRDQARSVFQVLQDVAAAKSDAQASEMFVLRLTNLSEEVFRRLMPLTLVIQDHVSDEKARLRQLAEDYDRMSQLQEKAAQRLIGDLLEIKESAKSVAQEAGVARYGVIFAQGAEEYKVAATRWLSATIVLGVATVIAVTWSIWSVFYYSTELAKFTVPMAIQLAVAKVVGFSMLFTALLWSGRMYRAHRHNYVVNRHRQNALNAFMTFVESARDPHTKDAVLLQATHSIFMPQSTGYLTEESEGSPTPPVFEVARTLGSS